MPFKSERQRRFLYAKHPSIARRWSAEEKVGKSMDLVELANIAFGEYVSKAEPTPEMKRRGKGRFAASAAGGLALGGGSAVATTGALRAFDSHRAAGKHAKIAAVSEDKAERAGRSGRSASYQQRHVTDAMAHRAESVIHRADRGAFLRRGALGAGAALAGGALMAESGRRSARAMRQVGQ